MAKRPKKLKSEFIDDEAELSGEDEISDDELEGSDDDQLDPDLVDLEAKDLSSGEEEEVRRLYHKQLDTEDKRAVLLLQEQLEDNDVAIGRQRRRKFHWQAKEIMENSLRRHYDPDDDDSQDLDEEEDVEDDDFDEHGPRLRRPIAGTETSSELPIASSSNAPNLVTTVSNDISKFVYRDKELVQALSSSTTIKTREQKQQIVEREFKRVVNSKSVFDQLYSMD